MAESTYTADFSNQTINELSVLLSPIFQRNRVTRAEVFGSFARGEKFNDYDFLVDFENGASLLDLGGLFEELKDELKKDVDIVTYWSLNREPEMLKQNILKDARVVYES